MPQFTKRAIAETFVRLLNERPLDKIAIKDIVDECQINRNTFYYYYQDIYALLEEVLEQQVKTLFTSDITAENQSADFLRAVQYAIDHKKALYHIYNSSRREQVEDYLSRLVGEMMLKMVREMAKEMTVSEEDMRFIAELFRYALMGKLLAWLRNGMKEEPSALFARAEELTEGVVEQMLRNAADHKKFH